MLARDHQRVAPGRRGDVHERHGVLIRVDGLRRQFAGDDLAEEAVGVRRDGGSLLREFVVRRSSFVVARMRRATSTASSGVLTSPVNTPASTSASRRPSSGPGSIPSCRASSSPAIGERGGPSRCQATAAGSTSRASSRCASIISGLAVGPRAAGAEPVGDREQRDVGGHRRGQPQVVVEPAPRQRPLVAHEPEVQVVQRERLQVARQRPAGLQPRARRAHDRRALAVVADEGDEPALVLLAGRGLARCRAGSAPKRSASPAVELVGERLGEQRSDLVGRRRPRSARGRARPRAGWRGPRACGRGRRGGGWGSAPRPAGRSSSGRTAAVAPSSSSSAQPAQRVGAGDQQPQLGELALAGRLAGAARRGPGELRRPGSSSKPSSAPSRAARSIRSGSAAKLRSETARSNPRLEVARPAVGIDRLGAPGRRAGPRSR